MKKPDFKKYVQEVKKMPTLPAASLKIPPLAVLAIISHIQLAIRHPEIADTEFAKIAIDVAKQLQTLFDQDSETYKVLELGWNPEADILTPSGELDDQFCEEPCDRLKKNLGCRCTGYKIAELVAGDDMPPQTLAASAAMMHQFAQSLKSEGFKLDM